ncbi:MAG: MBL fold metallo-hydrolase [Chloroflexi bacterium]|nr:MAG: MBL fold metallo-hydrolase [Chloroflexota bacterium]
MLRRRCAPRHDLDRESARWLVLPFAAPVARGLRLRARRDLRAEQRRAADRVLGAAPVHARDRRDRRHRPRADAARIAYGCLLSRPTRRGAVPAADRRAPRALGGQPDLAFVHRELGTFHLRRHAWQHDTARRIGPVEVGEGLHAVRLIGANAFLVAEDELTLVDAGHRGSIRILRRYLESIGRDVRDITRIVCTHGHPDHIGGVHEIARASGARVLMHPADMERLRIRFREVFSGRPMPGAIIAYLTQAPESADPLADGDELPVLGGLRVIHTPGHTPGSICLYSPTRRLVIVGDILQRMRGVVTLPNYVFTDDMSAARRSIARLADLDIDTILFSHYPALREGARDALRRLCA